jgi:protein ImuB
VTGPASRRYLAIYLPMLAEDCWRLGEGKPLPVVFVEKQNNAMRITACSRGAMAIGLTCGLTLADARARVPELVAIDRNPEAEARLLTRVVRGCARYTPMAQGEPPDGAILDITGCDHPYGGEERLAADLVGRLEAGGITARVARGDTPEQARALARFGQDGGDLHALPVEALEADAATIRALRLAGLKTIGALATRPRRMLAARFGGLALRLVRMLGEEDRHISPERPLPPISAVRRFAEPIGRVEDALACLETLGLEAAEILRERHQGGRRFTARFFRSDGKIATVEIGTGQPTRDPALLIRLFRERVDALADPIDPGFGFDLIRLDVGGAEPLAARQDDHLQQARDEERLAELIDRLAARLGPQRIYRFRPENSHIPECAASPCKPAEAAEWETPSTVEAGEIDPPLRPLRLLDPPQPIHVVHSVPDGPPRRFAWRGRAHEVSLWEGPERIAAEWWLRRDRGGRTRDYYRVEDQEGHRFWLFRHGLEERGEARTGWYIHGLFA